MMGVPGPKLMEEERDTQDFTAVSTPTFVTQDTKANAHLQQWSVKNAQIFHFLNLTRLARRCRSVQPPRSTMPSSFAILIDLPQHSSPAPAIRGKPG